MTKLSAVHAKPLDGNGPAAVPRAVFAVTVTGAFMVALDLSIVNVAFPSIEESFPDVATTTLSWVLSAYSVVFGALLLGAGRIADRSGRRRWFLRGLVVFALGSLVCGLAPSAGLLISGRVLQAVGAALLMPASLALLLDATPATLRAPAVAMWGGISALGVAFGPSLGSVLIELGGWRWAFLVNLPVALVAFIVTKRVVKESVVGGPIPDLIGIGLISIAVAALALGITEGGAWGWSSARVIGCFVTALVLGAIALWRSGHHPAPAIDLRLFENRTVALANAATLAYATGFFAMLLANVLFLTNVWGFTTLQAGLAITPAPLVVAALSRSTGRLAARVGYRPVLVAGGLVMLAAQVWCYTRLTVEPDYLRVWLPTSIITGVGVALSFPVLSAAAVAGLPANRFGVGGALNQTARQLGAVVGVAALVAIIGTPTSTVEALEHFRHAWVMCGTAALVSTLISLGQRRPPATVAAEGSVTEAVAGAVIDPGAEPVGSPVPATLALVEDPSPA